MMPNRQACALAGSEPARTTLPAASWPAEPTHPCPGVTKPGTTRPLARCTNCQHYAWASTGLQPAMRQRDDGTWHCENEMPVGVVFPDERRP